SCDSSFFSLHGQIKSSKCGLECIHRQGGDAFYSEGVRSNRYGLNLIPRPDACPVFRVTQKFIGHKVLRSRVTDGLGNQQHSRRASCKLFAVACLQKPEAARAFECELHRNSVAANSHKTHSQNPRRACRASIVTVEGATQLVTRDGAPFASLPARSLDFQSLFKNRPKLRGIRGQNLITNRTDFLGVSSGSPQIRATPAIELALGLPPA